MTPEQLEKNRAERRKAFDAAFAEQQGKDLEELDLLEAEHGDERVIRIDLVGWQPGDGAATLVAAKLPRSSEMVFQRFQQKIGGKKATGNTDLDAQDQLARSCLVYPAANSDLLRATLDAAPGILGHVAVQIVNAVQGKAALEGK